MLACLLSRTLALQAAIAYNGDFFTSSGNPSGSPYSTNFAVGSVNNTVLLVALITDGTTPSVVITYGGKPMTFLRTDQIASQNFQSIFYVPVTLTGSQTLTVNFVPAQNNAIVIMAASYTGVDQSNPIGAQSGATNSYVATAGPWSVTNTAVSNLSAAGMLVQVANLKTGSTLAPTFTPSSGTSRGTANYNINNQHYMGWSDLLLSSLTSTNLGAHWSDAGTPTTRLVAQVVELLPATGAFPPPHPSPKSWICKWPSGRARIPAPRLTTISL